MTFVLSQRYFENRDATTISYRKYNENLQDQYPSFSFCFTGTKIRWYNDHYIFAVYELNSTQFELMVMGKPAKKYVYNETSSLYKKENVQMDVGLNVNFDRFQLQLSDILTQREFITENSANDMNNANSLMFTNSHVYRKEPLVLISIVETKSSKNRQLS